MSRYSYSRKPKMDVNTWSDRLHSLIENRETLDRNDFSTRIRQLAGESLRHRFGIQDFVEMQQWLALVLAKEDVSLSKFACSRFFDVATHGHTIANAIWETSEHSSCRCPGSDSMTLEDWRNGFKDVERARHVREALRNHIYEPESLRECAIPKPSGGRRKLLIPTIEDRIIQRSISSTISPYLDSLLSPTSFGSRPKIDRLDAIATASVLASQVETPWVVAVDIKSAFPSTSKPRLMQTMRKYMHDEKICDLVEQAFSNCSKGMPQGAPISPVLVNLHLHHLIDKKWSKLNNTPKLLRYVDDLLIVCGSREKANECYETLNKLVVQAGYRLKTNGEQSVFDASNGIFEWLGYEVRLAPFRVSPGEEKWFELRAKLEAAIENCPAGCEEEYVTGIVHDWLSQTIPPMEFCQLESVQAKAENLLKELNLPVEFHSLGDIYSDVKRRWNRALTKAEKKFSIQCDAVLTTS